MNDAMHKFQQKLSLWTLEDLSSPHAEQYMYGVVVIDWSGIQRNAM